MESKKTTFSDFIEENPICKKFDGNAEAILFFETLSKDEAIIKMIDASDNGKPALAPVAKDIENIFESFSAPTISLNDNFTKQSVGLMVKSILKPFGYVVTVQKNMPKEYDTKYFKSASCYKLDENTPRTLKIVKKIEAV